VSDRIVLGLLRVVRAVFGLAGVSYALVGCSAISNAKDVGLEMGVNKLLVAFVCLMMFGLLRWVINKVHAKKYGVPHPSLAKEWSL
jgi:hypothetical protein